MLSCRNTGAWKLHEESINNAIDKRYEIKDRTSRKIKLRFN